MTSTLEPAGIPPTEQSPPSGQSTLPMVHSGVAGLLVQQARKSWLFRIGLGIVAVDLLLVVVGPTLATKSLSAPTGSPSTAPSAAHWFGTDPSGLDVFSRVVAAPRTDVAVGLAVAAISVIVGTALGLLVGFTRGRLGALVMRVADAFQAAPGLVFLAIIVVVAGGSVVDIVVVLGLIFLPLYMRLARAEALRVRELPFIEAAVANGDSPGSILVRHILPNAITPALAYASITIGYALLAVTGLSFIGAGVRPPAAEWGEMINAGANGIDLGQWWMSIYPGAAIALSVFGFAIVGEGLQRALGRRQ